MRKWVVALGLWVGVAVPAQAQQRVMDVYLRPTRHASMVIWAERIEGAEDAPGTFMGTVLLTQLVGRYGLGNRPGAMQMNSGWRWPYGRREGVLPIWAHRHGMRFPRVIFQNRLSEGHASRSSDDFSAESWYCLSFTREASSRDNLDAVSCVSQFHSDKGRLQREDETTYWEPTESGRVTLEPFSAYPPRTDITRRLGPAEGGHDHPDVLLFADRAREVMPEIDEVTTATPAGNELFRKTFTIPAHWADGEYALYVEINTEGDYNSEFGPTQYPTPTSPDFDVWARTYGYPYRGQPSVVYRVRFALGQGIQDARVTEHVGYGDLDGRGDDGGALHPADGTMTDDPVVAPGSGADRLRLVTDDGEPYRVRVFTTGRACTDTTRPPVVPDFEVVRHGDPKHQHEWGIVRFRGVDDPEGISRYEIKVLAGEPITDETFMRAADMLATDGGRAGLRVPVPRAGQMTDDVEFGGLNPQTHYHVAIRAVDGCNNPGPIAVAEIETTAIQFTTVTPCFVATAAYGSPLAEEIGVLRRFRDRHLMTNEPGRAFVAVYETVGPHLARVIAGNDDLRAFARAGLSPLVAAARWLQD
ncbi:MAG: hypothetical protein IT379_07745 [Deltaproteobacteria bacterium]|nr:hypothetical protein [Deltaproteobacteria bacterium]